jgi:hypothetical protein
MTANDLAMSLLKDGVPLALLVDLAGFGAPASERYDQELSWLPVAELAVAT